MQEYILVEVKFKGVELKLEDDRSKDTQLKDMDLFLKTELVKYWFETAKHKQVNHYEQAFRGYETMYNMIGGYSFTEKTNIAELIEVISSYLFELSGKPLDLKAEIKIYQTKMDFKELVDKLGSLLPKAFTQLNLWFKNVEILDDVDEQLSLENFGDRLTLIEEKKKELLKLSVEKLVELFTKNSLHDAYAKGLIEGTVKNVL